MMNAKGTVTQILQDPDFQRLKTFIIDATGLSYFDKKDEDLAGRIALRFAAIGQMSCGDYLLQLKSSSAAASEFDQLVLGLTIGETYFFRHSEQFQALRELIIPELILKNQNTKTLNIWCAGCATGAEPYSVSILLKQHFANELKGWSVHIYGTDINRSYLSRASAGGFNPWHLRSLDEKVKKQFFQPNGNAWDIDEKLRENVSFSFHNLITGNYPPIPNGPDAFDVILCRNVMIYFSQETIAKILPQFNQCLSSEGWLLLGYSEINNDLYKSFEIVTFPGAMLFKKKRASALSPSEFPKVLQIKRPLASTIVQTQSPPASVQFVSTNENCAQPTATNQPRDYYKAARKMSDRGNLVEALILIDQFLLQDAVDPRAHFLRGILLFQLAENGKAEEALRKAIYLDRNYILAHYQLGLVYGRLKQLSKSKQYFDNARSLLLATPLETVLDEDNGMTASSLMRVLNITDEAV